ncbi:uncharacterized protein (TIGR02271 family) [Microbacterium sp. AK009]|uniref:DUF2382 domain-containing protein n=1 Tax=Microbacterium sp. AK009 TaxID=2723068 RepID=UPI0015CDA43C|nr:PRC and DUF2382 domain-containing protein [Microbacterium sp. AK009]NYF16531.1 uncharacterized protein (TIGR02271 family) [Microbacterium sp. AK009]
MISEQNIASLIGGNVTDTDGHKIGTVGQIYVDPDTGRPNWATVVTGLFGTSESFVPLDRADATADGELRVPYSKDEVKDAPRVDTDTDLTDAEEDQLYEYYQVSSAPADDADTFSGGGIGREDAGAYASASDGYDTSGPTTDDAMTRSEEQLRVGTERVETGRARLRKYVVTEHETVTVPVTREEVRLEREPITDANADDALTGPDISEEEHEVVLTKERPVIDKETVPVERVRLDTEAVTDTETVDADVRKERIELDDDARPMDR